MAWRSRIVTVDDSRLPEFLRDPHAGAPDLACDTHRIREELGYAEVTTEEDALAATLAAT